MTDRHLHPTRPAHEKLYIDLCQLLAKYTDGMTGLEMLAVAANMVGKILAMQDQTKVTIPGAMELIAKNIEQGNRDAVNKLRTMPAAGRS